MTSGVKFHRLERYLAKRGVKNPAALAAWIGRKKLGERKMEKLALAGKRRK